MVATVPLVGVSLRVVTVNQDALAARVRDQQAAVATGIAGAIERSLAAARGTLQSVRQALVDESRTMDERLALAAALVESSGSIDHVAIYDKSGAHIDTLRREGAKVSLVAPAVDPATIVQTRLDEIVVDDAGVPRARIAIAIEANGKTTGYLVSFLALNELQAATSRLYEVALGGEHDSLMVVDARGRILARAPVAGPLLGPSTSAALDGLGALASFDQGFVRYGEVEDGGAGLVATVVSLPVPGVGVVVAADRESVYGSLAEVRRTVFIALGLAVVVAILLSLAVSRRLARPIARLAVFAEQLGQRRFTERVQVDENDEIGTLADALNGAARDLDRSEHALARERRVRADLGRFLPHPVVERLARDDGAALTNRGANADADAVAFSIPGHGHDVTVLNASAVDFGRFASKRPPEEVVQVLNELFSILTEIVFRHGGTVDKFTGDGVVAFWGAPEAQPDHAERAVRAARDMLRFVEAANETWRVRHGSDVQLAVGINSGEAVVGTIGSATRMDYTAIGATVNIAASLERLARPQQVLCSAATTTRIDSAAGLTFFSIGERVLPGYEAPLRMFALAEM